MFRAEARRRGEESEKACGAAAFGSISPLLCASAQKLLPYPRLRANPTFLPFPDPTPTSTTNIFALFLLPCDLCENPLNPKPTFPLYLPPHCDKSARGRAAATRTPPLFETSGASTIAPPPRRMMAPPVKTGPRFNLLIQSPKVRVIDENGENLGVMYTREAIDQAAEVGLDLVEVSPNADPPVCKFLDVG